jgi:putative DNA primase/helicase
LRDKFPRLRLVLCADNDAHRPGNPGLTHAREAARAVGGFLAVPTFKAGMQTCPF